MFDFSKEITQRRVYLLAERQGMAYHAGPKAPNDVIKILARVGIRPFFVHRLVATTELTRAVSRLLWFFQSLYYRFVFPRRAILIVQYPGIALNGRMGLKFLAKLKRSKRLKIIVLIHDIQEGRFAEFAISEFKAGNTQKLIDLADVVITHNSKMTEWLRLKSGSSVPMVELKLFDYLTRRKDLIADIPAEYKSVVIAGNLDPRKTGYITFLPLIRGVDWHLYGVGYDKSVIKGANVFYKGCVAPDDLPDQLETGFGLVWDGPSPETCEGPLGNYLRINNPHKLSLSLAAGLPVFIWREAAEAGFVREHDIGILIDSLYEIPKELSSLSYSKYCRMRANARAIAVAVRAGDYTVAAVATALSVLGSTRGKVD